MQSTGVIRFDALSKDGLQIIRAYENRGLHGVHFTYDPPPGRALMFWDSTISLVEISYLVHLISSDLHSAGQ